ILPDGLARWIPRTLVSLGTDGFGRSECREALRDFFEVDARFITLAVLTGLYRDGKLSADKVRDAMRHLKIPASKPDPWLS
ncbi:MAG TPA: hypothetical protein PKX28_03115, partial [Candidatus Hydrogenedentes bacterium]|nr:hypothetical protein [Candidatus Hydrogenedentota bacterium]